MESIQSTNMNCMVMGFSDKLDGHGLCPHEVLFEIRDSDETNEPILIWDVTSGGKRHYKGR